MANSNILNNFFLLRYVNYPSDVVKLMLTSIHRGDELQEEGRANDKANNTINNKVYNNRLTIDNINNRRRRINRLKTAIIIIMIIMTALPTILCIFLGLRVYELQKDVKNLQGLHGQLEQSTNLARSKEHYAYAAENDSLDNEEQEDINHDVDDIDVENGYNGDTIEPPLATSPDYIVSSDDKDQAAINDGIYKDKKVYLTFDDGPSVNTNEILDIMAEYNVKATFFVVGDNSEFAKKLYKRIVDEGHAIGLHSYSHDYRKIYNSLEDFDKDFTKLWDLLYDTIGFRPMIFRFPGGSANQVHKHGMKDFIKYLNDKSVVYFDWNVLNEDATGVDYSVEELIDNVISGVKRKNRSIVLMHDASNKKTTVDSLPELIETLLEGGATLLPLDEDVIPIQQIEASSIE